MPTTSPQIALRWRDECYGSVRAVAAFRNYAGTEDWSDTTHKAFARCLRKAGFEFNGARCSYIAETGAGDERKAALCTELKAAGFAIIHGDVTGADQA